MRDLILAKVSSLAVPVLDAPPLPVLVLLVDLGSVDPPPARPSRLRRRSMAADPEVLELGSLLAAAAAPLPALDGLLLPSVPALLLILLSRSRMARVLPRLELGAPRDLRAERGDGATDEEAEDEAEPDAWRFRCCSILARPRWM